ncbi:MAG: hypothetical protein WC238_05105 [Parcubacteria group bacterium]|jgi:hypothetical protein
MQKTKTKTGIAVALVTFSVLSAVAAGYVITNKSGSARKIFSSGGSGKASTSSKSGGDSDLKTTKPKDSTIPAIADDGENYFLKGATEGKEDFCSADCDSNSKAGSGRCLHEFYAQDNQAKEIAVVCDNGCENGACKKTCDVATTPPPVTPPTPTPTSCKSQTGSGNYACDPKVIGIGQTLMAEALNAGSSRYYKVTIDTNKQAFNVGLASLNQDPAADTNVLVSSTGDDIDTKYATTLGLYNATGTGINSAWGGNYANPTVAPTTFARFSHATSGESVTSQKPYASSVFYIKVKNEGTKTERYNFTAYQSN